MEHYTAVDRVYSDGDVGHKISMYFFEIKIYSQLKQCIQFYIDVNIFITVKSYVCNYELLCNALGDSYTYNLIY